MLFQAGSWLEVGPEWPVNDVTKGMKTTTVGLLRVGRDKLPVRGTRNLPTIWLGTLVAYLNAEDGRTSAFGMLFILWIYDTYSVPRVSMQNQNTPRHRSLL